MTFQFLLTWLSIRHACKGHSLGHSQIHITLPAVNPWNVFGDRRMTTSNEGTLMTFYKNPFSTELWKWVYLFNPCSVLLFTEVCHPGFISACYLRHTLDYFTRTRAPPVLLQANCVGTELFAYWASHMSEQFHAAAACVKLMVVTVNLFWCGCRHDRYECVTFVAANR